MKTTIDVPEKLLHQAKVVAAQRRITLRELMLTGLGQALGNQAMGSEPLAALTRLEKGVRLGGKFLTREQAHARP